MRADMDALPVQEETGLPFASEVPGVMHACGHDSHLAMLLVAARVLTELREELPVDILFVFQPAEEEIRNSGAEQMKDHPLVRHCDWLTGLHIWGDMEAGTATLESGPVMAASDTFRVEIRGRGGHGAAPNRSDPGGLPFRGEAAARNRAGIRPADRGAARRNFVSDGTECKCDSGPGGAARHRTLL